MLAFLRKTCGIIGKSPTKNPLGSSQETASINNVCSNFGYTNPPSKYSREVSCTAFWRSATCGPALKMARETFGKPSWGAVCVIFATSAAVAPCAPTPGKSTGPLSWDKSGGVSKVAPTTTPISPTGCWLAPSSCAEDAAYSLLKAAQVSTTCCATV